MYRYVATFLENRNSRKFQTRSFDTMQEAVAFLTYVCHAGKVMFEGRCVHSKPGV